MKLLRKVNKVWVAVSATAVIGVMSSNYNVLANEAPQSVTTTNQVENKSNEESVKKNEGSPEENTNLKLLRKLLKRKLLKQKRQRN